MEDLLRLIARDLGVFLTQEAESLNYDHKRIAHAVRQGLWHRVRRGAFVPGDVWRAADAEERHLIRAAAVHRSLGDRVAFSHVTAALLHGIPVWGVDLTRVHVTRLDGGAGRTTADVVHHDAACYPDQDVVRVGSRLVTGPARAALETGMLAGTEASLVLLDGVLHRRLATPAEVGDAYDLIEHWPGTRHLQVAVRMADARAESVGESRCRWMFRSQGVPAPVLQLQVRDAVGRLLGTTDFAWPARGLLGEFDGRVKYGRLLRPGETPGDAVFREKQREDELRLVTGHAMVRFVWHDLATPEVSCRRVSRLLTPAA